MGYEINESNKVLASQNFMVYQDVKSGLLNQSKAKESIINRLACIGDKRYVLLLVDIDNFQRIGEVYGQIYAETVLVEIANIILGCFDDGLIVSRISDDIFLVFYQLEDSGVMDYKHKEIVEQVRDTKFEKGNKVTVSVGAALYPDVTANYDEMFAMADIALCWAKNNGKNRCKIYGDKNSVEELNNYNSDLKKAGKADSSSDKYLKQEDFDRRIVDYALKIVYNADSTYNTIHEVLQETMKYYGLYDVVIYGKLSDKYKYSFTSVSRNITYGVVNREVDSNECENYFDYISDLIKGKDAIVLTGTLFDITKDKSIKNDSDKIFSAFMCSIYEGNEFKGIVLYLHEDKNYEWKKLNKNALIIVSKIVGSSMISIKSKTQLENQIFCSNAILKNQTLFNYIVDPDTYVVTYLDANNYTVPDGFLTGRKCYEQLGRTEPCGICPMKYLNKDVEKYTVEYYNEGNETWQSLTASSIYMPNTSKKAILLCVTDVTAFINRVRSVDALTGLMTLGKFETEASKIIQKQSNDRYAVAYVGLKSFTRINEEYGYAIGDEVLKLFASKISTMLKPEEMFCRINSDNFVLFITWDDYEAFKLRMMTGFKAVNMFLNNTYQGMQVFIECGVYPMEKTDMAIAVSIDYANIARKSLLEYKSYREHSIAIYDLKMKKKNEMIKYIEQSMYDALLDEEFRVFIQPKVSVSTGKVEGGEVLTRWIRNDGTYISPGDFIPIFEKNGFIHELDFYMYRKTFIEIGKWINEGVNVPTISVNLSRANIISPSFVEEFIYMVEKYKVPHELIELEITETMLFDNLDKALGIINEFRDKGFTIAIDDFGTGYSSLNLIKILPVDVLKIDSGFFKQNFMEEKDKAIIGGIASLAKSLGLKTVCEGVETKEQVEYITEISCDMIQGFYYFRPLGIEDFRKLI